MIEIQYINGRSMQSNFSDANNRRFNVPKNMIYDVAIIGGGFAGLSAALLLGRYLRPVVIFDVGKTRNDNTKHIHSYLGLENTSPRTFIKKAWKDVLQYNSVHLIKQKVQRIENHNQHFVVNTEDSESSIIAKYIIIATGVTDIKPDIKNFSKIDGNGAWHCPHCDGLEAAGKRLAIISNGKNGGIMSYAKEFLGWTNKITIFIQDNHHLDQKEIDEAKRLSSIILATRRKLSLQNSSDAILKKASLK